MSFILGSSCVSQAEVGGIPDPSCTDEYLTDLIKITGTVYRKEFEDENETIGAFKESINRENTAKNEHIILEEIEDVLKINKNEESFRGRTEERPSSTQESDSIDLNDTWQYKVLHQGFVGEDGINLTNDDSSETVFQARQAFIEEYCTKDTTFHDLGDGFQVPLTLWKSLFPHQRDAVEWLWDIFKNNKGGIEGDEMGLGKTCICSSFIGSLIQCGLISKPVLILCPLTVCKQWIRELHIWCPHAKAILLHETRTNKKIDKERLLKQSEGTPNIIVANYDSLINLTQTYSPQMIEWSCVICDEAQHIRNHEAEVSKLVKKLSSDFRLAMTSSPVNNNLIEFWSIFDFAYPGLLGTLDVFKEEYADNIRLGTCADATKPQVFKAYYLVKSLRDIIKPYILRRLKTDVNANLPSKTEEVFFCHLTKTQLTLYEEFLQSTTVRNIISGDGNIFTGVSELRNICNHPSIFNSEKFTDSPQISCKTLLLKKILPDWQRLGHRTLIFSQMEPMLTIIGKMLDSLSLEYFRIDENTQTEDKTRIVDSFNAGERFCCILSTKVGNLGVNLVGADRVIIVDPDWNPAIDMQELENAYRFGQTKQVSVYRLICMGTIEEKMYKKQILRQFLSNKAVQDKNDRCLFSPSTIRDIFSLDYECDTDIPCIEDEIEAKKDYFIEEEDDDSEDSTCDKELIKSLLNEGNIQKVLNHDDFFNESSGKSDLMNKRRAGDFARQSKKKLDKSGKLSKIVPASHIAAANMSETDRIQEILISLFKENGNKLTTNQILDRFKDDVVVNKNAEVLKSVLQKISVFNKRIKTWYVIGRFSN